MVGQDKSQCKGLRMTLVSDIQDSERIQHRESKEEEQSYERCCQRMRGSEVSSLLLQKFRDRKNSLFSCCSLHLINFISKNLVNSKRSPFYFHGLVNVLASVC